LAAGGPALVAVTRFLPVGTLYVVGTPIGNLEDVTLRALRTLEEATLIAAEDTRRARILAQRYEIETPITSYFEGNKLDKLEAVLRALDEGDVALISEAGMPGLSDPGYELIRAAIERGYPVVPVPGPSAVVTALVVSGLPSDSFLYLGFLPRRQRERRRLLAEVAQERRTLVLYEAPHRLRKSLADLEAVLGDRPLAACRELTKLYEEVWRGTVAEARAYFEETEPRGEFTLVVGGAQEEERER
jgi:16S rRNA (cytidine1402-2'-O)-methyltransferase